MEINTVSKFIFNNSDNHTESNGTADITISSFINSTLPNDDASLIECEYSLNKFDVMRIALYFFGIVANTCLLLAINSNKDLQTVTYKIISYLSVADLLFMVTSLIFVLGFVGFMDRITFRYPPTCHWIISEGTTRLIVSVSISTTYMASCLHIGFLSVARFLILVKPLWARHNILNKTVRMISFALWIITLIVCVFPTILYYTGVKGYRPITQTVIWTFSYPLVAFLTVTLHVIKVYKIRAASVSSNPNLRRMNVIAGLVISAFVILPLPWNILTFIFFFNKNLQITHAMWTITGLILILNNCSNPLIFGFMSDRCQNSLRAICCCEKGLKRSSRTLSQQTVSYYVSQSVYRP